MLDSGDTLAHNQCGFLNPGLGMYVAESKRLTHQGANKIMATAVDMANQPGIAISCAIVDGGGHMIPLERMEGEGREC